LLPEYCSWQSNDRKILLQNENGPCPLLAAANALLLKGVIHLPSVCVRNGCASLEEVVNMLAEKAMNYNHTHQDGSDNAVHEHIHELLDLIPNLQYGMDVNPKFTKGPTGMEFTRELTLFDMLNVRMVHGWLISEDESGELFSVIGSKTYNELVELVINGNEASTEIHKLEAQLKKIEACSDDDLIDVGVMTNPNEEEKEGEEPPKKKQEPTRQPVGQLRKEFREKIEELSKPATLGSIVNNFLEHTGHQLTQHGLSVLYEQLAENELAVFFRNNHFSTLTKHEGVLYLLVTDLGYANVSNVVWEKLDVIDGDTEYVNAGFSRPDPQAELNAVHQGAAAGTLDPEQLLAQRGQSEADYQLALQLSGQAGADSSGSNTPRVNGNLDEQEGNLMAAATEASLKAYNGLDDGISQNQQHRDPHTTQEDADRILAMQLQADLEHNDLRIAQQMQQSEWARQRNNSGNNNRNNGASTAVSTAASKASNCVIS
jgi:hypothetical protein